LSGSNPERRDKYRLKCVSLHSLTDQPRSHYPLEMTVNFSQDTDVYHTHMVYPFSQDSTPDKVGVKFREFLLRMRKRYPFLSRLPRVDLVQPDSVPGAKLHFKATIPPYTSLVTDDLHLFETLGFSPELLDEADEDGHGGFVNDGSGILEYHGKNLNKALNLSDEYREKRLSVGALAVRDPKFWVEFTAGQDWTPLSLQETAPIDAVGAAVALGDLLERGLNLNNLHTSFVEVQSTAANELQFRSKQFLGAEDESAASCELVIRFSSELARLFSLVDRELTFHSDDKREYLVTVPDRRLEDPLLKSFPLALLSTNHGLGEHYLEGHGRVSLLGYALTPSQILGEGLEVEGEARELRILFLDRHQKIVRSEDERSHFLALTLE
jgi:hypothetical protein